MHRYNNKYGYGQILREYCGQGHDVPIWGEIQHALFLNTRYFSADGKVGPPREQLQRFPRLLSWQTLLPFPHQIPIGDPMLYSTSVGSSPGELPQTGLPTAPFSVFMPKLNDEVPLPDRLERYLNGAREGIDMASPTPLVVALHPREARHKDSIARGFESVAEVIWAPDDYLGGPAAWSHAVMRRSEMLVSDYFGAHVFRASAYFAKPIGLVGGNMFNPGFHPTMDSIMQDFLSAVSDQAQQIAVSERLLGLEFQRTRDELMDILGFVGWKRVAGRPVRVVYQRVRRAAVKRRRLASAK